MKFTKLQTNSKSLPIIAGRQTNDAGNFKIKFYKNFVHEILDGK